MLDIVRLRVLAAVAAHGSVTAAAKALHYSQPSVSHHIARLEAETGARLIRHVGRGIRLTQEGELLARRAVEIIGRIDAADAELADLVGLRTGRVRLAAFSSALSVLIPPAVRALHERHPGIDLQFTDAHPTTAQRQLRVGTIDVAIVFHYGDASPDKDIRYEHLLDDPVFLLSQRADDTLDAHADSAWIAGCEHCQGDLIQICRTAGFTPRIAYTSDDVIVRQSFVAAGLGVTTMPALTLRSHHADGITASEIGVRRRISVATIGDPPDPPATAALIAALRGTLSGL